MKNTLPTKPGVLRSNATLGKKNTATFKGFLTLFLMVMGLGISWGQTALSSGDIAIISINTSTKDKLSVVLLKDITTNTVINFTDNGFTSTTVGRTGEGFLTYTAPSALTAGTVLTWSNGMTVTGTGWSSGAPTSFAMAGSGDQLFAFQGATSNWATQTNITLLYGVQTFNVDFLTTGTAGAGSSYKPANLTLGTNLVIIGNDNGYFANGSIAQTSVAISNSQSNLLTSFSLASNWYNSATQATFPTYTITVLAACTSPTIQTATLSANTTSTTTSNYAFTRGNGNNVLVVARLNATASVAPTSGTTYTPSATGSFTGTTTTGTGNIVVYNGAASGASAATGDLSLTNLTAGSYYTLTAYEYNTASTCYNTASPATVSFYTLCSTPISSTPTVIGSKSFTASWGVVTGAISYKLDVSTANDFSSFVSGFNNLTVSGTSQLVTGLNYNTTYYFRVRAINTNNVASADGNISSTTTKTAATSLVLVSVPTTGSVATNLISFTVEARRSDATVDDA